MDISEYCTSAKSLSLSLNEKARADRDGNGVKLVDLIQQVLSHQCIFTFGELLYVPSVQSLKGSEYNTAFQTLELFAYGTYRDYISAPNMYLSLNQKQIKKLRMLSILSLASENYNLPYDVVQHALDIETSDIRTLEDLMIECIYHGLFVGKLYQKERTLCVKDAMMNRDVRVECIEDMVQKLNNWRSSCVDVIAAFENSSAVIQSSRDRGVKEEEEIFNIAVAQKLAMKEMAEGEDEGEDHEGMKGRIMKMGGGGHFKSTSRGKRSRGNVGITSDMSRY